ncbi:MAG: hypothetical protein ACO1O1_00720 [Adhaeribacter sp.]
MLPLPNISRHIRVMLTALTLLCVMALNHREVTTYVAAANTKSGQQVQKTAAERHGTVKQKVSLEAPHAFLVLQLAACASLPRVEFTPPVTVEPAALPFSSPIRGFFKTFLSAAIQAQAP